MKEAFIEAKKQTAALIANIDNDSLHENIDTNIVQELIRAITVRLTFNIQEDIKQAGDYLNLEHFTLVHGNYYKWQPVPRLFKYGTPQYCYYNSYDALWRYSDEDLEYVEGYVMALWPILHAWNINLIGRPIDLTLRGSKLRGPASNLEYFGTTFNRDYVIETALEKGQVYSLLDDWEHDWPLLTDSEMRREAIKINPLMD